MLSKVSEFVRRLVERLRCEGGQAVAEYGLILALIAAVCVVGATVLGLAVSDKLDQLARCQI
jgi:Flp pilus assembly pilin Flp